MHYTDIYLKLYEKGYSISKVAKLENTSSSMIIQVIKGQATSHSVAFCISGLLNTTTEKLWPGKYLAPALYKQIREVSPRGRLPAAMGGN